MKKIVISLLGLIIIIIAVVVINWPRENDTVLRVDFLNVGQGDSILIRMPDRINILIDTGADRQAVDSLSKILANNQRLDYLLITHADHDHYGGTEWLLEHYQIGQVIYNGETDGTSFSFQSLLRVLDQRKIPLVIVHQGQVWRWPSGVEWQILWPALSFRGKDRNQSCVVSQVKWGKESVLLPCDLPLEQETALLKMGDIRATIYKAGHHGSKYSSGQDFINAVHAQWCVLSVGENSYGHPHPAAIRRMEKSGCQLLSTKDNGTLSFVLTSTTAAYQPDQALEFFGLPMPPFLAILKPLFN